MKKFRLLLLDANVVIEIARHQLWARFVEQCDVQLSRTVVDEAQFFEDASGERHEIDLAPLVESKAVEVFELKPSDLTAFRARFDPVYFEKLDAGETESLAYLLGQPAECRICSADAIVFRVLGMSNRSDQGVSLQEVLESVGLGRVLAWQFTRAFREKWTATGIAEGMTGMGMNKPER